MEKTFTYIPVLKGKSGEFKALKEISTTRKAKMAPIIELVGYNPPKMSEEKLARRKKPVRTYDDHLSDNLKNIIELWDTGTPIFIDTHLIPIKNLLSTGRSSNIKMIHSSLFDKDIIAIPVISPGFSKPVMSEYKSIINKYKHGACLRLSIEDIDNDDLAEVITNTLTYYGLSIEDTDLVIDFGYVAENQVNSVAMIARRLINNIIDDIEAWRTLTLVSGSFPIDLSAFGPDTATLIERSDWRLWIALIGRSLKRKPVYGDYAIANPIIRDLDGIPPNMSASIRYTSDNQWLIMKGKGVKGNGFEQTHRITKSLTSRAEYEGEHYSPGDLWIMKCSKRQVGPGNPTTWRMAGTSHHLHKVLDQLSSLSVI